jgi:hypothetical protein
MAEEDAQPRRRGALFGVRRDYVDALEAKHAEALAESAELTSGLRSARLALDESAGWSKRLPAGLAELASLAAGDLVGEDVQGRLGAAVLALAGEHLLARVEVSLGEPAGELDRDTTWNDNGRPIRTLVRLGGCAVDCTWQPGVDAGPDTTGVIEGLCSAVVCSLAGVAASRVQRDPVTQLGDERSLARHEALRERLRQPAGIVRVVFDENSTVEYQKLFGGMAWDAALSRVAADLDEIARAHGGQAYQVSPPPDQVTVLEFRLLLDADDVDAAAVAAQAQLADYDGLSWRVDVP